MSSWKISSVENWLVVGSFGLDQADMDWYRPVVLESSVKQI